MTRRLMIGVLFAASSVHAQPPPLDLPPRMLIVAGEVRGIEIGGAYAAGVGLTIGGRLGGSRLQALGEVAFGGLLSEGDWIGRYVQARVGGRFRAATLSSSVDGRAAADFVLDAGIAVERDWLDGTSPVLRPSAFAGWTIALRSDGHRAFELVLRLVASPPPSSDAVPRAICRGMCSTLDAPPFDVEIAMLAGVSLW
jgi:hypothetical protein